MIKPHLILCCLMLFSVAAFGQNTETDLRKSFQRFSVASLNNRDAARLVQSGAPLEIKIGKRSFRLVLHPNDVRAADYRAEYTDANGRRRILPRAATVSTFQGIIEGEPNSTVALTVDGETVEGYFATASKEFFIEAARNYSKSARADEKVVYRAADKINADDGVCGLDERLAAGRQLTDSTSSTKDGKAESGADAVSELQSPTADNAATNRRILEVATEADTSFVINILLGNGDPARANAHILSVMNQVDAAFRRDLNLRVVVTFQHAWMPGAADPYGDLRRGDRLYAFADYWNVKFPISDSRYQRDVGHLFTLAGGESGLAIMSAVCQGTAGSYAYTSLNGSDKWVVTAHELGHNFGAEHACFGSIMGGGANASITGFCQFSIDQINRHISTYGDRCLNEDAQAARPTPAFDFDGDGRADIAVWRPSNGVWYVAKSTGGFSFVQWGQERDQIVPGDYDGDGRTDYAVYRVEIGGISIPGQTYNNVWYVRRSSDNGILAQSFGGSNLRYDQGAPADYDGDLRTDLALYNTSDGVPTPGYFEVQPSSGAARRITQWGFNSDRLASADYDGDGKADVAVFRPENGTWYILQTSTGVLRVERFGQEGDRIVPGDYDADGKADIAAYRPSNGFWYRLNSRDRSFVAVRFGASEDKPVPADYDADGRTDIAVYRPSNGTWYLQKSTEGFTAQQFGAAEDVPIPKAYVQ